MGDAHFVSQSADGPIGPLNKAGKLHVGKSNISLGSRQGYSNDLSLEFPAREVRTIEMASKPSNRIAELRARRKWSQERLAREINTSNQQISRLETGAGRLTQDWMARVAKAFGVRPAELLPDDDEAAPDASEQPASEIAFAGPYVPSKELIPVFASAEAGKGEMSIGEQIGTIPRPPPLYGVDGAYAVHIVGDSMEPVLEQGTLVWVSPFPPRSGQLCVIQLADDRDGEHRAMVKRYRRSRGECHIVIQYNPEAELEIDKAKVVHLHKIVGATFE